jgi:hypothetical protein
MAESPVVSGRTTISVLAGKFAPLWAVLAVSIALNLALGALLVRSSTAATKASTGSPSFSATAWYAVFVNSQNQEAFVGHVSGATSTDITMKDIYYLTFEAKDAAGNQIANPKADEFKPVIKKLGQEVYGPKDTVTVNRLNLRYYTELRDDSQVVKAITAYEHPGPAPSPSK